MSPGDVTGKYAVKIVAKQTVNGTIMQWEFVFSNI
jgi:hypothetical protein